MSFPTTSVIDSFNRSNVGPPLGGNWSTLYDLIGFKIVSEHIEPGGSALTCGEYWNAATFGPDSEAYITDLTVDTTGAWAGIVLQVRMANPGSSTMTGYEVDFYLRDDSSTVGDVYFYRLDDSATFVQLGATVTGLTFSNGVTFGIEMIGTTLKAYYKPSGGSWTEIGSRTDSTYDSAGYIGVGWWYTEPANTDLDDFGGGTVVAGSTPSPNVSDGITLGESQTVTVSDPQIGVSDSLTVGESSDVDVVSDEPGGTLSISVTPDNPAYQVRGVKVYP